MKLLKISWIIIVVMVAILIIRFKAKLFGPGYTMPIINAKGEVLPESIAILEEVTPGDMKQNILI
ncbi:MAG: hypothetical protein AVO34_00815 [Firmicutes bacterium ML8_F2]|jgi:hypothetical protein|nr:MAG: hypothetical protein AVO34_00815 [Firmicutes bacterium ML8_F2]